MKRWYFWVGLAVSAIFLYLALRGLQIDRIWQEIRQAEIIWFAPAIFVYFISLLFRSWRWKYLLNPIKKLKIIETFPVISIGYMGNNIYPARAGEIFRAALLKRDYNVSISGTIATILAERIFDGIVILSFVFINLSNIGRILGGPESAEEYRRLAFWGAVIFLTMLIIFLAAAIFPQKAKNVLSKLIDVFLPEKWNEKAINIINRFIEGLASLRSPKDIFLILSTSALIWILETIVYWFVMRAFPFRVDFSTLVFMNGVVNLAASLPSGPGFIGTFDAPGIAVISEAGINPNLAAGYTLTLHAVLWLPVTLVGGIFLARAGIRLSRDIDMVETKVSPDE